MSGELLSKSFIGGVLKIREDMMMLEVMDAGVCAGWCGYGVVVLVKGV